MDTQKDKCTCTERERCIRCINLAIEAHNDGYTDLLEDLIDYLNGDEPTDKFADVKSEIDELIQRERKEAVKEYMHFMSEDDFSGVIDKELYEKGIDEVYRRYLETLKSKLVKEGKNEN